MRDKRSELAMKRRRRKSAELKREARRRLRPTPLYAYTDESGSDGRLFETDQPFFSTLTLISRMPLETIDGFQSLVDQVAIPMKRSELKGSWLGLSRIELVADNLGKIIEDADARFVLCAIDKSHYAGMKFYDTVMDAGLNPGADRSASFLRPMKMVMMQKFVENCTEDTRKLFWTSYMGRDSAQFSAAVKLFRDYMIQNERDLRVVELLRDACDWAIVHPSEVLSTQGGPIDAPNVTAFSMLLHGIHEIFQYAGSVKLSKFVHDEQEEFSKQFALLFPALKQNAAVVDRYKSLLGWKRVDYIDCELVLGSSRVIHGLQLVDVCLYLAMQSVKKDLVGGCGRLLAVIEERLIPLEMTPKSLHAEAQGLMDDLTTRPMSELSIAQAKAQVALKDQIRKERMRNQNIE